jgi:predicted  nucleic acid-binding Zn-ribbon protein
MRCPSARAIVARDRKTQETTMTDSIDELKSIAKQFEYAMSDIRNARIEVRERMKLLEQELERLDEEMTAAKADIELTERKIIELMKIN